MTRTPQEVRERSKLIRKATPNVLEELYEMQKRRCDLCGEPIQDLIVAALNHSIPVIDYARGPLPIEEAVSRRLTTPRIYEPLTRHAIP